MTRMLTAEETRSAQEHVNSRSQGDHALDHEQIQHVVENVRRTQAAVIGAGFRHAVRWTVERAGRLLKSWREFRDEVRAVRDLQRLDDRTLRDIGIYDRASIAEVVRAYRDADREAAASPVDMSTIDTSMVERRERKRERDDHREAA